MLELLYLLVKYGYYSDRHDINALISPLISLLDGKYDKPFPCANSDETQQFIEVYLRIYAIYMSLKFGLIAGKKI